MDATTTQLYISLLERTNQQLSLWSNPYGVLVSILSFLVAFLAIAAAVILYRQTKEYRELFQNTLKDYETTLKTNLEKIGLDAENKIQIFINTKKKDLETLTGDTKKQAEKIIKDLEKEKNSIGSRIQFSSLDDNIYEPILSSEFSNPLKINEMYWNKDFTKDIVYCPGCGSCLGINSLISNINYCSKCGKKIK